jgi:uncharacterized protein YceK
MLSRFILIMTFLFASGCSSLPERTPQSISSEDKESQTINEKRAWPRKTRWFEPELITDRF